MLEGGLHHSDGRIFRHRSRETAGEFCKEVGRFRIHKNQAFSGFSRSSDSIPGGRFGKTPIGEVTVDHRLAQSYDAKSGKIELPNKLGAMQLLAKMCGWQAPERHEIDHNFKEQQRSGTEQSECRMRTGKTVRTWIPRHRCRSAFFQPAHKVSDLVSISPYGRWRQPGVGHGRCEGGECLVNIGFACSQVRNVLIRGSERGSGDMKG